MNHPLSRIKSTGVFLLLLFSISFSKSQAQEFEGGIIAGFSGTSVLGDNLSGFRKPGVYAGGFATLILNEVSSFQMELCFIQKGSKSFADSSTQVNYGESYLLRINYVELPILYKYQVNSKISAEGGISYGVLVSKYENVNGIVQEPDPPFEIGDLSGNFGLYYQWRENLDFNIRLSHSILAIRPHYGGGTNYLNQGQYNQVLSLTVRYKL